MAKLSDLQLKPHFLVDAQGNQVAVQLSLEEYQLLIHHAFVEGAQGSAQLEFRQQLEAALTEVAEMREGLRPKKPAKHLLHEL